MLPNCSNCQLVYAWETLFMLTVHYVQSSFMGGPAVYSFIYLLMKTIHLMLSFLTEPAHLTPNLIFNKAYACTPSVSNYSHSYAGFCKTWNYGGADSRRRHHIGMPGSHSYGPELSLLLNCSCSLPVLSLCVLFSPLFFSLFSHVPLPGMLGYLLYFRPLFRSMK
jgi:hypothetical protein